MQFMFVARHFACSVICALGRHVSVQKGRIIEISEAIWWLCDPKAPSVIVLGDSRDAAFPWQYCSNLLLGVCVSSHI